MKSPVDQPVHFSLSHGHLSLDALGLPEHLRLAQP
jgi:hypothetical protein